jgi:DNA-binding MarR family transcriptional regulator
VGTIILQTNRDILIQNLFENMNAMKRGMSSHVQIMNRDCPIPRSQLELLFAIRQAEPVNFKHLAQQLYLTPGAISQLAEGLEQHDLIGRQVDADDRRIQCLHVSKKGIALLHDVEKRRRDTMEAVIEELSDEELELWLRIQEKMIRQFQAEPTQQTKKETTE